MSRIPESRMMSPPVTRLNIPFTHLLKSWMGKTGMSEISSRDIGLVSDEFINIDKVNNIIKIITNAIPSVAV